MISPDSLTRHSLEGGVPLRPSILDSLHAFQNRAEDNVAAIKMRGLHSGDEELTAVGILTSIGHGEKPRALVFELEVLVLELLAID